MSKIAVSTIYTQSNQYGKIGYLSSEINRSYAEKNGYDFCLKNFNFNIKGRHFHFEKQLFLLSIIDNYDWVLYLDADAFVTNPGILVESLIDDDYDLIMAPGNTRLFNAGVMLLKNTENTKKLLRGTLNSAIVDSDNNAMIECYRRLKEVKLKLIPRKSLNSYGGDKTFEWESGDFIMHMALSSNEYREKKLENFIKYRQFFTKLPI